MNTYPIKLRNTFLFTLSLGAFLWLAALPALAAVPVGASIDWFKLGIRSWKELPEWQLKCRARSPTPIHCST